MGELPTSPTAVGLAPNQISARPPPLEREDAVAREGSYALRRSRRGGRSRRDKKQQPPPSKANKQHHPETTKTILKRLAPTDLAAARPPPLMFGADSYEAHLRDLQLQRHWYLLNTAPADPSYFPLAPAADLDDPPPMLGWAPRCHECDAAAAAMRQPPFHRCVRDAVTVGFRSHVGPIERPAARKTPSPPPDRMPPPFFGMSVY